jgi:hypothetical protein
MPITSPGNLPTGTIRDLGLPGRAVTALTRAGVTGIEDLALLSRRDLAGIAGLGPGMIAAIRQVVPEPSARGLRSGAPGIDADTEPAESESPAAPPIPSFDSLRDPRRRPSIDVLVPGPPPVPPATAPLPRAAPRPPDYADLLRLGVHVVRAMAGVTGRIALWSVQEPVRLLRRVLGDQAGPRSAASGPTGPERG